MAQTSANAVATTENVATVNNDVVRYTISVRGVYDATTMEGNIDYKRVLIALDEKIPAIVVNNGVHEHGERDLIDVSVSSLIKAAIAHDENFRYVAARQESKNLGNVFKFNPIALKTLLENAVVTFDREFKKAGDTYELNGVVMEREFDGYFTNLVSVELKSDLYPKLVEESKKYFFDEIF